MRCDLRASFFAAFFRASFRRSRCNAPFAAPDCERISARAASFRFTVARAPASRRRYRAPRFLRRFAQ